MSPYDGRRPTGRPSEFMRYPRSTLQLFETALPTLKEESRECIYNLQCYHAPETRARFPRSQSAAVLVPLFVGRAGDLYVLLSRRSEALRAYAGDTALPGGKLEPQDVTIEDTARREAFEEIGLPQDKERVPLLCVLEPFLAGNQMIVTPVVVLILDKTLQPNLNSSEVTSIFSHPLAFFLSSTAPFSTRPRGDKPTAVLDTLRPYHTFTDYTWTDNGGQGTRTHRQHSFLTGREADGIKPVFGLTAAILIHTAMIGYSRPPAFELYPPSTSTPTPAHQIAWALLSAKSPLRAACEREGIDPDRQAARVLRAVRPRRRRRAVGASSLSTAKPAWTLTPRTRKRATEGWKKIGALWMRRTHLERSGRRRGDGGEGGGGEKTTVKQQNREMHLDNWTEPDPGSNKLLAGDHPGDEEDGRRRADRFENCAQKRAERVVAGGDRQDSLGQGVPKRRDAKL